MADDLTGGTHQTVAKGKPRLASKSSEDPPIEIKGTGNAKVDAMGDVLNNALAPFQNAPPPEQGTLGVVNQAVGGILGLQNVGMELMNTGFAMATAGIAAMMPAFPAAFLTVPHIGTPHAHSHPPSLVPPAPPVPLPSIGTLMLAGSVGVLVCGMPAARCGDLGLAVTCGSLAPAFDVFLGSSNTFIAGNRAARMTDMTRHCNPASAALAVSRGAALFNAAVGALGVAAEATGGGPVMGSVLQIAADLAAAAMSALLGKDPGIPPAMGALMMGAPTVLIGGFPCPNLPNPLDALMHGLKCLGKAFMKSKGLGKLLKKVGLCNSPGEPINPFTGEVYNDFPDYQAIDTGFVWERHYRSGWNQQDGPLGYGFRHFYQRTLTFHRTRVVYETHDNETVALARNEDGSYAAADGFTLSNSGDHHFELCTDRDETLTFELQATTPLSARLTRYQTKKVDVFLFYDSAGRLYGLTESARGAPIDTRISYDAAGHIAQLIRGERGGNTLTIARYVYHDGCMTEWHDPLGGTVRMRYDDARRMVQGTDRRGYSFHWQYDGKTGRCIKSGGDDGLWGVEAKYEGTSSTFTEPDGGVWTFKHYPDGVISHILDPLGGVMQYVRDERGRIVQQITPAGAVYVWLYRADGKHTGRLDPFGEIVPPEDENPNPPSPLRHRGPTSQIEWLWGRQHATAPNSLRRLPSVVESALVRQDLRVDNVVDHLGRVTRAVYSSGASESFQRDAEGNLIARQDTKGQWWQRQITSWNLLGAERTPLGGVTRYGYSHRQKRTLVVDANGNRTDYKRDQKQRVIEIIQNGKAYLRYKRGVHGAILEERDGGDALLVRHEANDLGLHTSTLPASGESYSYAYDELGNFIEASSSLHRVEQRYSARLLCRDFRDGVGVRHEYFRGQLVETALFERFIITYRSLHGKTRITTPGDHKHRFWRAADGSLVRENGNGKCEAMVFDARGHLAARVCWRAQDASEAAPWVVRYQYDYEGRLQETADSEAGITRYEYDADGRLITQQAPFTAQADYRYDPGGNLSFTPSHGPIERLTDNLLSHSHIERFEYDARQRLSKRTKFDGSETNYTYDSLDQLVRVTWNDRQQIWSAGYDGLGRRLWRQYGQERTNFYWDGDRLAAEVAADGSLRLYVYATQDALVPFMWLDYASVEAPPDSGTARYLYCAPTGMPLRIEDADGQLIWHAAGIGPYGEARDAKAANLPVRLRFAGHFQDEHLGLFYNRFRDYDPGLARYLQPDPLGHAGGANLYAYPSNPTVDVDLRGLVHKATNPPEGGGEQNGNKKPSKESDESKARQALEERTAAGGTLPDYAKKNPELYEYDPDSGKYRRKPGEGHSRESEFKSNYSQETHDEMAKRYTDEGKAQGRAPLDTSGERIPHDQLTWRDPETGEKIPYNDANGDRNLTYDHQTSTVEMWNNGATTTDPDTGETRTYPPGRDTDRETRNAFYDDPNNLQPMSKADNSAKGGNGTYNDTPTGPNYEP